MKKTMTLLLIMLIMSACRSIFIPTKGAYPSDYSVVLDKSPDLVMNNIVDYCFKNNISLKAIDRKSGLIITEPHSLNKSTFENPNNSPEDSSAHIIIGRQKLKIFKDDIYISPDVVKAEVVFKVKEEDNKTSMTIMLSDISTYFYGKRGCLKDVKTTGSLERQIINEIK